MCGIIGIIGKAPVSPLLVDALKRLEYRGYDSAGVATLVNGHIERRRAEGKLTYTITPRMFVSGIAGFALDESYVAVLNQIERFGQRRQRGAGELWIKPFLYNSSRICFFNSKIKYRFFYINR